jgi:acetyl esterase/lipase
LVTAAGCGSTPASAPSPAAPRTISGIAYAPAQPAGSAGHLLDLYLPPSGPRPAPLVVWSTGTAWLDDNGSAGAGAVARLLNPRGYAVAGVGIRSSSQATFPAQLSDIKAAIRFLRARAGRYHLDAGHVAVAGDSSGGWAAAMAAVTGDVQALEGDVGVRGPSSRVQAAVLLYPPTAFLQMDPVMQQGCAPFDSTFGLTGCHADPLSPESRLLGCPITTCADAVAAASPLTYVSRTDPPLLLLHGQRDVVVPWQQSLLLFEAVHRAAGRATLVLLPRGQHGQALDLLTDPDVTSGATVQQTAGGRQRPPTALRLGPDVLLRFLDENLR